MDRASGSGVFARDPDALLDLIELDITDELLKQEENKAVCDACVAFLETNHPNWDDDVSQDDQCSEKAMLDYCKKVLSQDLYLSLTNNFVYPARQRVRQRTAWRIEGTLREFPKFSPVNLWFDYPAHYVDNIGVLKDVSADGDQPPWKRNLKKKKSPKQMLEERKKSIETAFEAAGFDGQPTVKSMAEYMGITEKTVRNRLKEHGGFWIDEGNVGKR
jgi:RecA-family ATPase